MERIDSITGKPFPEILDETEHDKCGCCGTVLVFNCIVCGAPVCCPKCCKPHQPEH